MNHPELDRPGAFRLDGGGWPRPLSGSEPVLWVRGRGDELSVWAGPGGGGDWVERWRAVDPGRGEPYVRLAAAARALSPQLGDGAAGAGFAGCFAYDLGRRFERVPQRLPALPRALDWDFLLGLHLAAAPPQPVLEGPEASAARGPLVSELSATEHRRRLLAIQELIRDGSLYQANLTFRCEAPADPGDAPDTYRRLLRRNPAPWAAWMDLPGVRVASASPECFLIAGGSRVGSGPIKGTAARRAGAADARAGRALLRSDKDRAELAMIVDLMRNDLGRVCEPGSVSRGVELQLERHPEVWHLVGWVRGKLALGRDPWDLLQAAMPPGSCVGAPKIRAMAELEALEASRRGPYTGALGWVGLDGSLQLNVAIRTIFFAEGRASFGIGGGIVHDSEPDGEWAEALLKGRALARALRDEPAAAVTVRDVAFP